LGILIHLYNFEYIIDSSTSEELNKADAFSMNKDLMPTQLSFESAVWTKQ